MKKIVIIGGGAAGLMAAVEVSRALKAHGMAVGSSSGRDARFVDVALFEASDRVGRSILATGNGRCNFSHAAVAPDVYRNAPFVAEALNSLGCGGVHEAFARLGLVWREESEGRLYPLANKASSVLDVLYAAVRAAGVREVHNRSVVRVSEQRRGKRPFRIQCEDGSAEEADVVIVAGGGKSSGSIALPGVLSRVKQQPVLGPLRTDVTAIKSLNNIRVRCEVALFSPQGNQKAHEQGEILFRDYGVSGIAVFNLSRFACPKDELRIDFLPHVPADETPAFLKQRAEVLCLGAGEVGAQDFLSGMVLPAVAKALLKYAGIRPDGCLDARTLDSLAKALKAFPLAVKGVGDARQCQVTRGGYAVESFDPATMEAREVAGLYVVGEALDIDAPCGGYNLHWAWASGMLAGRSVAACCAMSDDFSTLNRKGSL